MQRPARTTLRHLLAAGLALAAAATAAGPAAPAPNETVIDAQVYLDPLPGASRILTAIYPVTIEARFVIDRAGRPQGIRLSPDGAPDEHEAALRAALERWRFHPALGACRHVEQEATATVVFEEKSVRLESLALAPVTARRALRETEFSWLYPPDGGDRRTRPRAAPAGFVEPYPLKQVPPRYPATASRKAQPGIAFVLFEIGVDGKVGPVHSSDGWTTDAKLAPQFAKEAVAALKQWRFEPAKQGGKPLRRLACQRFLFNMKLGS